jgi:acetyl-CoA carboxylase biotin carboxylase subunit
VWGRDRNEAIARLDRALAEMIISGVSTTTAFHRQILANESFRRGDVHTGLIAEILKQQPSSEDENPDSGV